MTKVKDYRFARGAGADGYGEYQVLTDKWNNQDNSKTAGWLHKPQYRVLGVALEGSEPTKYLVLDETEDREFIEVANSEKEAHLIGRNYCFHSQLDAD